MPVYEMEDRDNAVACRAATYVLDIAPGPAIGFSIAAGAGMRFTLVPASGEVCGENKGK